MRIMVQPGIGSNKTMSEKEFIILMDMARQAKEKIDGTTTTFVFKDFEVKI